MEGNQGLHMHELIAEIANHIVEFHPEIERSVETSYPFTVVDKSTEELFDLDSYKEQGTRPRDLEAGNETHKEAFMELSRAISEEVDELPELDMEASFDAFPDYFYSDLPEDKTGVFVEESYGVEKLVMHDLKVKLNRKEGGYHPEMLYVAENEDLIEDHGISSVEASAVEHRLEEDGNFTVEDGEISEEVPEEGLDIIRDRLLDGNKKTDLYDWSYEKADNGDKGV